MTYQMHGGPLDGGEVNTDVMPVGAHYFAPVEPCRGFNPCDAGQETRLARDEAIYRVHYPADMTFVRFRSK